MVEEECGCRDREVIVLKLPVKVDTSCTLFVVTFQDFDIDSTGHAPYNFLFDSFSLLCKYKSLVDTV